TITSHYLHLTTFTLHHNHTIHLLNYFPRFRGVALLLQQCFLLCGQARALQAELSGRLAAFEQCLEIAQLLTAKSLSLHHHLAQVLAVGVRPPVVIAADFPPTPASRSRKWTSAATTRATQP